MSVDWLFKEAHRRRHLHPEGVGAKEPITEAWIGLGYLSNYKDGMKAGYFVPLDGDMTPRIIHWFLFTEKGAEEYYKRYPNDNPTQ